MSTPTYKTGNPYFDQPAFSNLQKRMDKPVASSASGLSSSEEATAENFIGTEAVALKQADEYQKAGTDFDDLRQEYSNLDEFTGWNPNAFEQGSDSYFEQERRRRRSTDISSKRKKTPLPLGSPADILEIAEEQPGAVEKFFGFIDSLIQSFSDLADEAFAKINPFSNWIAEKPRKIKMAPPPLAEQPPMFLRESLKPKRSPHLWKSDPKPWWHLAFGDQTNNKVVENLIKYQNDTITADA